MEDAPLDEHSSTYRHTECQDHAPGLTLPKTDAAPTEFWLLCMISSQDKLRSLISQERMGFRDIPPIWPQMQKVIDILGTPGALQMENRAMARAFTGELITYIETRYPDEPEALDQLVRLHNLDDSLWPQKDLQGALRRASLSHLDQLEKQPVDPGYHIDLALEYYTRSWSMNPTSNDDTVLQKLATIGKARLNRAATSWEQRLDQYTHLDQIPEDNSKVHWTLPVGYLQAREDLDIGIQCMSQVPPGSFETDFGQINSGRTAASVDDSGVWRNKVIHCLKAFVITPSKRADEERGSLATLWSPFTTVLECLEAPGTLTADDQLIRSATSNFLTYMILSGIGLPMRRDRLQVIELLVRSCSLSADSWPEHCRTQRLGSVLEYSTIVHLREIEAMDTGSTNDVHHLDTALEYYARLTALGHTTHFLDMPDTLARIGNSRMSKLVEQSQIPEVLSKIERYCSPREGCAMMQQYLHDKRDLYKSLHPYLITWIQSREYIEFAVECISWSVKLSREDNPELSGYLQLLAYHESIRDFLFISRDRPTLIDKTIEYQTKAVALTPPDHPDRPARTAFLARLLNFRFYLGAKSKADMDKAVELLRRHSESPTCWNQIEISEQAAFSKALDNRFEMTGAIEDISQAIEVLSRVVQSFPDDYPPLHKAMVLINLGVLHRKRFLSFGNLLDIDRAVEFHNQASLLQAEGKGPQDAVLWELIASYRARLKRLRDPLDQQILDEWYKELDQWFSRTDFKKRVDYDHKYWEPFPVASEMPLSLEDIFPGYGLSIDRTHPDMKKLDANIQQAREMVQSHRDLSFPLTYLSEQLFEKYIHTNDPGVIQEAIDCMKDAMSLEPVDHPEVPNRLYALARFYFQRLEVGHQAEDYHQAVNYTNQALSHFPFNHVNRPGCLFLRSLAHASGKRHCVVEEEVEICNHFREATFCVGGDPFIQFTAAYFWAIGAKEDTSYERLEEAFTAIMSLFPQVVWIGDTVSKRFLRHSSSMIGSATADAAAGAIRFQKYSTALEWLEQGRSMVWNQTLQLRTPIDNLESANPTLAHQLKELSAMLHKASFRVSSLGPEDDLQSLENAARKHRRAAEEYSQLIDQTRAIPEFRNFLQPKSATDLLKAAKTGPIVVVNVSDATGDALILVPGRRNISHLPLPMITRDSIQKMYKAMTESLRLHGVRERGVHKLGAMRREAANHELEIILGCLWLAIAEPVLDFLGFLENNPQNPLPRLTWCTVGQLSMLPLHAAGFYNRPRCKISDFVVSSYTPTLNALLTALSIPLTPHTQCLAISQETSSKHNLSSLPGTRKELAYIESHAKDPIEFFRVHGSDASCELVLEAMEHSDWVHLACHAKQDSDRPIESGFFLADGILTLDAIIQKSFKDKGLAFLSACQTAKGDEELVDEAVHLASGMLLAGYRSVIATMWSVSDSDAPEIANEVYGRLMKNGKMDYGGSARALHEAVDALRESVGERSFARWVPYVHIGA